MNIKKELDDLVDARDYVIDCNEHGLWPDLRDRTQVKHAAIRAKIIAEFEQLRKERDRARAASEKLRQLVVAATDLAQEFSRNLGAKEAWAAAWKAKAKEYRKRNSDLCDEVDQIMWDT